MLDDFAGKFGLAWRQTDMVHTELICHLLEDDGQYSSQVRVVAFNTAEGWSRDVSDEIATELAQACADRGETPPSLADFIANHNRPSRVR